MMSVQDLARDLFLAGIAQIERQDFASAEKSFTESLALVPDRPSSLDNLSVCLLKLDKLVEAEEACRKSLKFDPASSTPWFNLGLVQRAQGNVDEAIRSLQKAISIDADYADSWHYSGLLLCEKKRYPEAAACFERVILLMPDNIDAMCLLGTSMADLKLYFSAIAVLEKAISIAPENALPLTAKARVHRSLNEYDAAIASYKLALELDPLDRNEIEFALASLTGHALPKTAPKNYVAGLFDEYANNFEEHLVEKLEYKAPYSLFSRIDALVRTDVDVLDLGCGTGLMGPLLRNKCRRLVGVDVSRNMLIGAAKKEIYDELVCGDNNELLSTRADFYDVVVAADVFVYVGDLAETFLNVSRRMRNGGIFAFTVEAYEGDGYQLNRSRRYSHSEHYCRQLAQEHGFVVRSLDKELLRMESSAPDGKMMGLYLVLEKT